MASRILRPAAGLSKDPTLKVCARCKLQAGVSVHHAYDDLVCFSCNNLLKRYGNFQDQIPDHESTVQVARRVGRTPGTVLYWVRTRLLPQPERGAKKALLWRPEEVNAAIALGKRLTKPPAPTNASGNYLSMVKANKDRTERLRAAALCLACGGEREPTRRFRNLCLACASKVNASSLARYYERKAQGLCAMCGYKKRRKQVLCRICIDKVLRVRRERLAMKKAQEEPTILVANPNAGNTTYDAKIEQEIAQAIEQELKQCLSIFDSIPIQLQTERLKDEFTQMSPRECTEYASCLADFLVSVGHDYSKVSEAYRRA